MRSKGLLGILALCAVVLFGYGTASAQVPEKVKDAAGKAKDVTVDAAKKTAGATKDAAHKTKEVTVDAADKTADVTKDVADKTADVTTDAAKKTADVTVDTARKTKVIVTDNTMKAADATADAAVATGKAVGSKTKSFGKHAVTVTDNVQGEEPKEGGKYYTVTSWDGSKWVSKRVWYPSK